MHRIRIALAQINPTVGDLDGNVAAILAHVEAARAQGADLVVFPELAITGYPPEDLLLKPQFVEANLAALERVAAAAQGILVIVGFVDRQDDIYNAAAICCAGQVTGVYHKQYLPNYGVFDEARYFRAGREATVWRWGVGTGLVPALTGAGTGPALTFGVNICEDIWYPDGPTEAQAFAGGAQVIINLSASPYHAGKGAFRERMLATRAADNTAIVAFCNMVGGQDELVFDGQSLVFDPQGNLLARGRAFEEDLIVVDLDLGEVFSRRLHDPRRRQVRSDAPPASTIDLPGEPGTREKPPLLPRDIRPLERLEEIYRALVLGTRDYARKNGFQTAVVGMSGGIDSSLVVTIAADALGPEHVVGVRLPSRYTSEMSQDIAARLAANLGIHLITIPIEPAFEAFLTMLAEPFAGTEPGVAEENIQARIRGAVWMALSNKFGWLALTAGNKSEMAVGYATLYGDMAGGFSVIKDVPKTLVYELARWRNAQSPVIPEEALTRPPTAELRPGQKDTDSLPPYEILDPILQAYVEEDRSAEEIVALGFDRETVARVIRMVDRSEYKRRQSPPGIKITPRAFGRDRRLPITNRWGLTG
ncbi:MAG: NAD+ synthase [Anaerolineae bacterium]|nr:NAD+ synthase [Anaerolineae bacterium]